MLKNKMTNIKLKNSRTFKAKFLIPILLVSSCLLIFSCNDLKKISNQLETVKGNQDILITKQIALSKSVALLQKSVTNINVASNQKPADNKKPQQKRKNPNPDFVHDLPIGGSVVMGNPNARVTITEFTDFQ